MMVNHDDTIGNSSVKWRELIAVIVFAITVGGLIWKVAIMSATVDYLSVQRAGDEEKYLMRVEWDQKCDEDVVKWTMIQTELQKINEKLDNLTERVLSLP